MTRSQGWLVIAVLWLIAVVLLKAAGAPGDVVTVASIMSVGTAAMAVATALTKD